MFTDLLFYAYVGIDQHVKLIQACQLPLETLKHLSWTFFEKFQTPKTLAAKKTHLSVRRAGHTETHGARRSVSR